MSQANTKIIDGVVVLKEFDESSLPNPDADSLYLFAEDSSGTTIVKYKTSNGTETTLGASVAPDAAPFDAGNITGSVTLNRSNGRHQKASATGDITLLAPSNGTEGQQLKLTLLANGFGDINLSLNAAILIPSDSTFTSPKVLTSGKRYIIQLEHNGTAWMLTTLIGGYA